MIRSKANLIMIGGFLYLGGFACSDAPAPSLGGGGGGGSGMVIPPKEAEEVQIQAASAESNAANEDQAQSDLAKYKTNIKELELRVNKLFGENKKKIKDVAEKRKMGCFLRKKISQLEITLWAEVDQAYDGILGNAVNKDVVATGEGTALQVDLGSILTEQIKVSDSAVDEKDPNKKTRIVTFTKAFDEEQEFTLNDVQRLVISKPVKGPNANEMVKSEEICTRELSWMALVGSGFFSDLGDKLSGEDCGQYTTVKTYHLRELEQLKLKQVKLSVTAETDKGESWTRTVFDEIIKVPVQDPDTRKTVMHVGRRLNNLQNFYGFHSFMGNKIFFGVTKDVDCETVHDAPKVDESTIWSWLEEMNAGFEKCPEIEIKADGDTFCISSNRDVLSFDDERLVKAEEEYTDFRPEDQMPEVDDDVPEAVAPAAPATPAGETAPAASGRNTEIQMISIPLQELKPYVPRTSVFLTNGEEEAKTGSETELETNKSKWEFYKGIYDELRSQYFSLQQEWDILTDEGCFYRQPITSMKVKLGVKVFHSIGGEYRPADKNKPDPKEPLRKDLEGKDKGVPTGIRIGFGFPNNRSLALTDNIMASKTEYTIPPGYFTLSTKANSQKPFFAIKDIKFIRIIKRGVGAVYMGAFDLMEIKHASIFAGSRKEQIPTNFLPVEEDIILLDWIELIVNNEIIYAAYEMGWTLYSQNLQFADFSLRKNPTWRRQSGRRVCTKLEMMEQ